MPPLKNKRHELFCLSLFQGMTQKDAAIKAGFSSRSSDMTASRLMRNDKISARLTELHHKAESPAIMDVRGRKERLSYIAEENNEGKFGYQRQPNISAIAELNKMEGDYAPSKLEVDAGPEVTDLLSRLRGYGKKDEG